MRDTLSPRPQESVHQPCCARMGHTADMDALSASVVEGKGLGFEGRGCIHPRQIAVIHEAFAPTEAGLANARRIVEAFEDAQKRGLAVVSLGTKMIDPPVVKRAQRTVTLPEAMGMIEYPLARAGPASVGDTTGRKGLP